jgi:hypothetical protein
MGKSQKKTCEKAGRNADSPAHQRYLFERRWMKHTANHVARQIRKHPNYKLPADLDDEIRVRVQMMLK